MSGSSVIFSGGPGAVTPMPSPSPGGSSCDDDDDSCPMATAGDPIYMKTGEFQYSFETLTLPGPIRAQLVHTYGNQRDYNAYYGPNWTINYDIKISVSGDQNTITLYDSKAFSYEFERIASNLFAITGNANIYIVETSADTYELVNDNGIRYRFYNTSIYWPALRGTLFCIEDEHENKVSFRRDTKGRITKVTDCFGRDTTFSYDTSSPYYLMSITDFENRTWSFSYDAQTDDLLGITYPATDEYQNGLTYDIVYDNNHNLTKISDPNDDEIVEIYYNLVGEVYKADKQDLAGGQYEITYDPATNSSTVKDREGHETDIYYTDEGLVSKRIVYTDDPTETPNSFTTEYIYNAAQKNTRVIYPEGNCVDYTYNADGYITGIYRKTSPSYPNDPNDTNVIATIYTYVDSSNPLLASRVETERDPEGNITEYEYGPNGLVTKKTLPDVNTPSGSFSTVHEYTYYANGDPNTIIAPYEVITKYVYYDTSSGDPNNGMLWKKIVDYGQGQDYLNLTTEYAYDALQRIREVTDPNGAVTTFKHNDLNQLTEVVNALGYTAKLRYDYNGNRKKIERETSDPANPWQTTEITYDTWGKPTKVKDALGNETTFGYDNNEKHTSVTNALDEQTTYTYDERGLLTKVTDPNDGETTYTYDDNGNSLSVTDPSGIITDYEYDGFGFVAKITDAEGNYRVMTYDKNGRVIKKIAYDGMGTATTADDVALMQSRLAYNAAGDLIQYAVMADAESATAVDPNTDMVTEYAYAWAKGPKIEEAKYYGGTATCDATTATTYYDYDTAGRLIEIEDPDGNTTDYYYDKKGRVIRIQKVDYSTVSGSNDSITMTVDVEYDALGKMLKGIAKPNNPDAASDSSWQTKQFEYDKLSNRTKEIRPNSVEVIYEYDLLGRKTEMAVDPTDKNQVTEYGYDILGRPSWIAGYTDDTDNDTKQRTDYTYDNLGRVTKITYPDDATIEYAYNPAGKVIKRTDQRIIETYYEYDDVYNMTEKEVAVDSATTTESFTYDGLKRMLTATKYEGAFLISDSEFAYNDIGRVTDANDTYLTLTKREIDYTYDNAGYRIRTVYPDGLTTIDRTNTHSGMIDTLSQSSTTFAEYDYMGPRTARKRLGSCVYYAPEYDNMSRMVRSYTYETNGTTSPITDFDFDYVADENNIGKTTFDHRASSPYNEYAYDNLDRLTEAVYLVDTLTEDEVFTMDDLGNRTNVNLRSGSNEVYDVNDLTNRYASIADANCLYDAAGNLTVDKDGYQYTYDYENRIVKIEDSYDNEIAAFAYDALSRRIKKTDSIASTATYYYYNDLWQVLAEYDGSSFGNSYVYGNNIDEVLRMNDGTNNYYYAHDHLFSPVALMEDDGDVIERYEYDAYGRMTRFAPDFTAWSGIEAGNPYYFTGRRLDVLDDGDYKVMYYRNRYYDTETGRFLQHDPLGVRPDGGRNNPFDSKKQYLDRGNLYEYVGGNPTVRLDPLGLGYLSCLINTTAP